MTPERAAEIVGADHVRSGEAAASLAVSGRLPAVAAFPGSVAEAVALITSVGAAGGALVVRGGGTQIDFGAPPSRLDLLLGTERLQRVVDYQPDDMTVTVEPGVTLSALAEVLAPRRQFLPLDPAFPNRATVGGVVAAASSGSLRAGYGTPRDWVIGCRVVGGDGREVRGGGQVVKNVAGYDLPKLYTGSFGTLGLITEVTFKVLPLPPARGCVAATCPTPEALGDLTRRLLDSDLQPTAVDGTFVPGEADTEDAWRLVVEFRHVEEAVEWQCGEFRRMATESGADAERLHEAAAESRLREAAELAAAGSLTARLSGTSARFPNLAAGAVEVCRRHGIPPRVAGHAATGQVMVAAGAGSLELARDLREMVGRHQGLCVFPSLPDGLYGRIDPWDAVGAEIALMRGLKSALDPRSLFSPGRFVGGI
jgi:glycolate oxidase FAD binding subunit